MELQTEGILFILITTFLSSALGAPALVVDSNPSNYGTIETLTCTDATYTSGNGYDWKKDGVTIFNNVGEISTTGKYSESINRTNFKLVINDIVVNDEGSYTCSHNFADSLPLSLEVESRGNVTAELLSSKYLEVTLQQIYPNTDITTITCDSTTVVGHFKSSVADGDRYINTWQSNDTFTTKPTSCSALVTLRTTFNTAFTVISASTEDKTSDTDAIVGGTVGGVLGLCCLAAAVVGIRHLKKKGSTTTLTFVEGSEVTFSCPFPESVTFPEWRGPPGLTIYTILDDTSGTINSKIPAFNRLQCASNKRDLILSNAVVGDSGDYKCSYTGQGDHTFTLKVNRGKSDRASNVVYTGSHPEERQRLGRPQPPLPNSNHREGSGSVVSGRDVEMQETDTSLRRSHDRNVHHPANIVIPTRRAGALEPISAREEV